MSEQRAAYDGHTTPYDPMIPVRRSELTRLATYAVDGHAAALRVARGEGERGDAALALLALSIVAVGAGRIVREDAERLVALFPPIGS